MKKYFVASDIHSFYTPFIKELNKTGFVIYKTEDGKNKIEVKIENNTV